MQVLAGISSVLGIFSTAKSLFSKEKKPAAPKPLPKTPTMDDAAMKADEETKKRQRRVQQTDLTRGGALVPELNVDKKVLIGY